MEEIKVLIEKAQERVDSQDKKVKQMEAQLRIMQDQAQKATNAVNNEVIELAVRRRLLEELKELLPKGEDDDDKQVTPEGNEPEVVGDDRGSTGTEHPVEHGRRTPPRGDGKAPAPDAE